MKTGETEESARRLGSIALAGIMVFASVCTAAQFVRSDLDWMRAPLSAYLLGESGAGVSAAYFALGTALVMLGLGYYRALATNARSGAPLLLFAIAAAGLGVTALADSGPPYGPYPLEAVVHNLAASTAFLGVTSAMLLQSWRLRADAAWRRRFVPAFALAILCFLALWGHALWAQAPRGLTQKATIVLILAWLAQAAIWLRNRHSFGAIALSPNDGTHETRHEPRP